MALGPKTDNTIECGDGNTQFGHNSGTVTVGLTFEQHQTALKEAVAEKAADLERAYGAEKTTLQRELSHLQGKLQDIEEDYKKQIEELVRVKTLLMRYDNQLDQQKREAAFAAIDSGETTLAEALLKELAKAASARREDAAIEEAEFEFELGKLAEAQVRWHDAYDHYKRAVALHETTEHLIPYARMTWRLAKGDEAVAVHEKILTLIKAEFGDQSRQYAAHLNNLASVVQAQGRYPEAEALYRDALAIGADTIGTAHPSYATNLNNLAGTVRAQGLFSEAEVLYREALAIDADTIGTAHPDYATRLNNLAGVVRAQGRYAEAEALFRDALAIDADTIGTAHPDYATGLSNLGVNMAYQEKFPEAHDLLEQALTIRKATLPADHPAIAKNEESLAAVIAKIA
ncbi:MAG: tetratricopeptide (TPR) repeat protein [Gammaproteobacteria bacterium]|jgi:tetratricopeptide (TPR) repeat protein